METLIPETVSKIRPTDPLRLAKQQQREELPGTRRLIRFLRQSMDQGSCLTMSVQENHVDEVIIQTDRSVHH